MRNDAPADYTDEYDMLTDSLHAARGAVESWTQWAELHVRGGPLVPALTDREEWWEGRELPDVLVDRHAMQQRWRDEAAAAYTVAGVYRRHAEQFAARLDELRQEAVMAGIELPARATGGRGVEQA